MILVRIYPAIDSVTIHKCVLTEQGDSRLTKSLMYKAVDTKVKYHTLPYFS